MLVRVAMSQVRLGMYVSSLECSWLNSPFWRTKFLLSDQHDLDRLRGSDVAAVIIDSSKGLGVATEPASDEPVPVDRAQQPAPLVERRAVARKPRPPAVTEVDRARATVERSKAAVTRMFTEARLGHAVQFECVAPLVEEIAASVSRDRSAMLTVTRLKTKNEYTYLHSVAVCALMINLARHIGLPKAEVRDIGMAGLLHDIGKMAMPEAVLDKPGTLDADEFAMIRTHPEQGHLILSDSHDVHAMALDVCLHHHERIDGRGYPFGLKAEEISIPARMGAICDVYDAVTSNRPYKRAWPPGDALARMLEWDGHFDPDLLRAFIASIGIPPLGALVRLHSNRLGIVIESNDANPMLPIVRAFFTVAEQEFVAQEDVGTANIAGCDPIVGVECGEYWFGTRWTMVRSDVHERRIPSSAPGSVQPYIALSSARSVSRAESDTPVARRSAAMPVPSRRAAS